MKKIYIDGLALVDGHFSGVGQYILGIVKGMDELLDDAKNKGEKVPVVNVVIPYNTLHRFKEFNLKHVGYKLFPLPFRYMAALWYRGKLPWIDLWCGPGNYIFPRFADMPLLFNKSKILTIFDLSYELHRQYSDEGNAMFLSRAVKESVTRAEKIITISKNAKKEIVDFYGVAEEDVKVATPAVDQTHFYRRSQSEIDRVKLKYGITAKRYILALSNLEPRKNLEALVDAYCALDKKTRKETALLLVGVNGWRADTLFKKILQQVEEGYDIIRPSEYVTDEDKPAIISGACMLVYPSHYEGFGMPPLEALACGVPVITADNSSLPEVVKGVGAMVPSNNRDKLYKQLVEYLENLEKVTSMAQTAGPAQAEKFSWKKSAQTYLDIAMGEQQ